MPCNYMRAKKQVMFTVGSTARVFLCCIIEIVALEMMRKGTSEKHCIEYHKILGAKVATYLICLTITVVWGNA